MEDNFNERKSLLNTHFDNLRQFQLMFFDHIQSNNQLLERQLIAALYSFSALGIYSLLRMEYHHWAAFYLILVFSVVILINLVTPTILTSKKDRISQQFLDAAHSLVIPLDDHKDFKEYQNEYNQRMEKLGAMIDEGNKALNKVRPFERFVKWSSIVLITCGWGVLLFLISP